MLSPPSIRESYYERVAISPVPSIAMAILTVALLVIGILGSTGVLNGMGTANAAYLSYGMYAGVAVFFVATCILCCVARRARAQSTYQPYIPVNFVRPAISSPLTDAQIAKIKEKTEDVTEGDNPDVAANLKALIKDIVESPEFRQKPDQYLFDLQTRYFTTPAGRVELWEFRALNAVKEALKDTRWTH